MIEGQINLATLALEFIIESGGVYEDLSYCLVTRDVFGGLTISSHNGYSVD